jgi:hypothetical protein
MTDRRLLWLPANQSDGSVSTTWGVFLFLPRRDSKPDIFAGCLRHHFEALKSGSFGHSFYVGAYHRLLGFIALIRFFGSSTRSEL